MSFEEPLNVYPKSSNELKEQLEDIMEIKREGKEQKVRNFSFKHYLDWAAKKLCSRAHKKQFSISVWIFLKSCCSYGIVLNPIHPDSPLHSGLYWTIVCTIKGYNIYNIRR